MRSSSSAHERAVREHAAVVRRLHPPPHPLERRPGRAREGQRRARRTGAPPSSAGVLAARPLRRRCRRRWAAADRRRPAGRDAVGSVRERSVPRRSGSRAAARSRSRTGGAAGRASVDDRALRPKSRGTCSRAARGRRTASRGPASAFGWTPQIDGCRVGTTVSASSWSCSCSRSPARASGDLDRDVLVGPQARQAGSSGAARSMIDTGLPMSRRNTLPSSAIAPAWSTRLTASGIVMKYRVISGSVTVTGPPSRI